MLRKNFLSFAKKRCFSSTSNAFETYGFIGLGKMGQGMAQNLRNKLSSADNLIVYDISKEACEKIAGDNIIIADNVQEVGAASNFLITSLPTGRHISQVYERIAEADHSKHDFENRFFVDTSTVDVASSRFIGDLLKKKKIAQFVDAPVSGGVVGAKNGTLTFMAGSNENKKLGDVLHLMGQKVFWLNHAGAGLAAKLANNYILALQNIATAEGFQLAKKMGLDMQKFTTLINASTGRSWTTAFNNPTPNIDPKTPSSNDYNNGFSVDFMKKDLVLAIEEANRIDQLLLLGEHAAGVYDELSRSGLGKKDMSVVYKVLE